MLKAQEIKEIIKYIDQSSISEFKYEHDGSKISLKKYGAHEVTQVIAAPSVQQQVPPVNATVSAEQKVRAEAPQVAVEKAPQKQKDESLHKITSPMVGTFYAAPSPDSDPYVKVGDKVNTESVVCIVEAMKLMNEIEAEIKGEIVEILVENGQLVEYGQEMFLVKPE